MSAKVCVPLVDAAPEEMLETALKAQSGGADLVEFRLDAIKPAPALEHVSYLIERSPLPAVATCRSAEQGGLAELPRELRFEILKEAVRRGAAYVDVEWPDETVIAEERIASGSSSRIIASLHDFEGIPDNLDDLLKRMEEGPADVIKAAVAPACASDTVALLEFIRHGSKPRIIIGMGLAGLPSRILGPLYGAEFTFAAIARERGSAPGQMTLDEMRRLFRVQDISGSTLILGIIGNPIGHSLSPLLHNTVFRELDIDAVYLPFEVKSDAAGFVRKWSALHGLYGASVTIPHKTDILNACARLDESVTNTGAANTLYSLPDGGFAAANNDAPAVTDALIDAVGSDALKNAKVLVLGAGGVARAAVYALVSAGCRVIIANIINEDAAALALKFGVETVSWEERTSVNPDILANMTSVGMHPNVDALPIDTSSISKDMIVFDAVYNPLKTRLLEAAEERGAVVVAGVEMFLRQAARQLQSWFSTQDPPLELMRQTILEALQ